MTRFATTFIGLLAYLITTPGFAEVIDLTVDSSRSNVTMTLAGDTEFSTLSGVGQIDLQPAAEPFQMAQITDVNLVLDDGFSFSVLAGLVRATMQPGEGTLSMVTPGPPGTVSPSNTFDQFANESEATGMVSVVDPFNLAGGTRTVDLSTLGTSFFDLIDVQLNVNGSQLEVVLLLDLEVEVDTGLTLVVTGTVVANGTLPPPVFVVPPSSLQINSGVVSDGVVGDLELSDNVDLSLRRNPGGVSSVAELELKAISPLSEPASLEFAFESSVFARSTVTQTIWLFDYDANQFEEMDVRNASRFSDVTVTVSASGDLSRFVEPGTGCMLARIRYRSPIARQQFTANMDQAVWTIQ